MLTPQQQEALDYFRKHATDWRANAEGAHGSSVNVIEQRNQYVLDVAKERSHTRASLDVGCGTGELVCQLALRGIDANGVDYAPEMIDLAAKKARENRIEHVSFRCASVFELQVEPNTYDLISANGFIEYISQLELVEFFRFVVRSLRPGGSLVVGSRNRLFNLVSMNEFTLAESASGELEYLLREAVSWTTARTSDAVVALEAASLQAADIRHKKTGIDVATRFQYTPFQLINLLKDQRLDTTEVYPVHVHGVTPAFAAAHPELHTSIANVLQLSARGNLQLLTHASSFMLHAMKAA